MARYLPVLVALALLVYRLVELRMRHDKVPGQVKETGTLDGFVIAGTVLVLGGVTEYLMLGRDLSPVSFGVGLALIAASVLLRRGDVTLTGPVCDKLEHGSFQAGTPRLATLRQRAKAASRWR